MSPAPRPTVTATPRWQRGGARATVVALLVALLGALIWSLAAGPPSASPLARDTAALAGAAPPVSAASSGPTPTSAPGLRADVQRWIAARNRPLVRLNNALVPIVFGTVSRWGPQSVECRELDASTRALRGVGPSPDARITELATTGLAEIQQAAGACLEGDPERTRQLAEVGLQERAAVSLELDDALEGE